MLTSSFAPGAAAAKYWNLLLDASTRPETRPPSACSHSINARSRSIDRLDRVGRSSRSAPGAAAGAPSSSGSRACSPTSTTIVLRPRSLASRPSALAIVVLPTPPLPVTTSSSRCRIGATISPVCLIPARAASTYNRAMSSPPTEGTVEQQLVFDERGLAPCVVQDWNSGEVLTLSYINAQALARTRETGELHLYSRSREELWHKGATSGNVQQVKALRVDCDGDALLALVVPAGPACHTGERTCFHRGETARAAPREGVPALERTIRERAEQRPAGSYTVELLDDRRLAGAKVEEEAEEVARAAREESEQRVDEEAADLIYHLLVLIHGRRRSLTDAERVLDERRR